MSYIVDCWRDQGMRPVNWTFFLVHLHRDENVCWKLMRLINVNRKVWLFWFHAKQFEICCLSLFSCPVCWQHAWIDADSSGGITGTLACMDFGLHQQRWLAGVQMPSFKMVLMETCPFGPVSRRVVCVSE